MSQTKPRESRLTRQMLEDELDRAHIRRVNVTANMFTLYPEDGRIVGMPTVWSSRLSTASEAERQNYEVIGHGAGLHWPDLGRVRERAVDPALSFHLDLSAALHTL